MKCHFNKHAQIVIGNTYNVEDIMSIPTSISKAIKPVVSEKDINQYTVDKYILQIYLSNEIPKLNQYIISNEKIDEAKRKGGAKFEKAAEEAVKTLQKVARGLS